MLWDDGAVLPHPGPPPLGEGGGAVGLWCPTGDTVRFAGRMGFLGLWLFLREASASPLQSVGGPRVGSWEGAGFGLMEPGEVCYVARA